MKYPYLAQQLVWGHDMVFWMHSPKSESWYGDPVLADWDIPLHSLIRPGDVVLDVGANEGWTTCVFARAVGPEGWVVAVEADANNVLMLMRNVEANRLQGRVTIRHRAAADATGRKLHVLHEVIQAQGAPVLSVRLDDVVNRADVIKMDVEGYELFALQGAERLLGTCRAVEVELHNGPGVNAQRMYGHEPRAVFDLLLGCGLAVHVHQIGRLWDGKTIPEGGCIYGVRAETKEAAA